MSKPKTAGRQSWRASKSLLLFTATLSLFTENFLYGFIVPILPYMVEKRLKLDPAYTQRFTAELLFVLGLVSLPCAPVIGHFADRTSSRKVPLLVCLAGCTIGTVLVAATPSVWVVFVGRILQGIAGSGTWIVCLAMLTDAVDQGSMGRALGFSGTFITGGIILGPAVSGVLLQWLGYWPAWSAPLALLALGFVARLAMIEHPSGDDHQLVQTTSEADEHDPLLQSSPSDGGRIDSNSNPPPVQSPWEFYRIMLAEPKVLAGILNIIAFAVVISGFDATLPIHLRDTFGWGPARIGGIFLSFQIPGMIFGPLVGWLRDRIGLRWPTSIGWILAAPLVWFAGVPSKSNFLGIGAGARGESTFVACMISIGVVFTLSRGAGTFQLATTLNELRTENPVVFGAGGGSSRIFSMTDMSFKFGLMIGPLLCGLLSEAFGFYYTCCVLAIVCVAVSISSATFFTHKSAKASTEDVEDTRQSETL